MKYFEKKTPNMICPKVLILTTFIFGTFAKDSIGNMEERIESLERTVRDLVRTVESNTKDVETNTEQLKVRKHCPA